MHSGYLLPMLLLMIAIAIVASFGNSFIAQWIGYEFTLFLGGAIWMLYAISFQERCWVEYTLISQIFTMIVPICTWYKHQSK